MEISSSDRSVHSASIHRQPSQRTINIVQILASTNEPLGAQKVADSLNETPPASYNSVYRTMKRLVKKGPVIEEPERQRPEECTDEVKREFLVLFKLNHEALNHDPSLFLPYVRDVSIPGRWEFGRVKVHRVGFHAETPRIQDKMCEVGVLHEVDLAHVKQYRGRSVVFDAEVQINPDSSYYQRACEPDLPRTTVFQYEDFMRSLAYFTRGNVDVRKVWIGDLEVGSEGPDLLCDSPSRIIIYPKRGRVRIHSQHKDLDLPPIPGPQEHAYLLYTYLGDLVDAITTLTFAFQDLLKQMGREIDPVWTPKTA